MSLPTIDEKEEHKEESPKPLTFMEKYEKDLKSLVPRNHDRLKSLKDQLRRTEYELDLFDKFSKSDKKRFRKIQNKIEQEKQMTINRIKETKELMEFYDRVMKSIRE